MPDQLIARRLEVLIGGKGGKELVATLALGNEERVDAVKIAADEGLPLSVIRASVCHAVPHLALRTRSAL